MPYQKVYEELKRFSKTLTTKFSAQSHGEPEAQLNAPVENLFTAYKDSIKQKLVLKDESKVERLGRPDYAVEKDGLLIGYIELKEPGKGANPEKYKGHDAKQWERFKNIPNILYTSANEWALYRNGKIVNKLIRIDGDVCTDSEDAVSDENAKRIFALFTTFTSWTPIVPDKPKELAEYLAPFCRLIRDDVLDALEDKESPMQSLKVEIQNLLFPDADDFRFADAYAQTVIFALLLAHLEYANVLDLHGAYEVLEKHHSLLSRALEFLTDKSVQKEISMSLSLVQRVIHATPRQALSAAIDTSDPWLFFYENFLAAYDPELRKKAGVYYTPLEVAQCQVRLIDEILQEQFGKEMGFIEADVVTLDPAVGTGTYLLAIITHALMRVKKEEGIGAVKGGAQSLIQNLHGFEWMVGPYAVAQLRFSQAFLAYGISLPDTGAGIYLTNTLESPHTKPPAPPLFSKPIAQEHERALKVKDAQHVLVCLGNPPYGRHESAVTDGSNKETTGSWVRYGSESEKPILEKFLKPARDAGHGVHLKNIYNHYIYFIRWALWKVFEHKTANGPGIVSFITASSYIDGDAFSGVREHLRKICDHVDIIDLGGEGRGTRKDENVFAIQTPVAIFLAWRKRKKNLDTSAEVRYTKIEGTREEKLEMLGKIKSRKSLKWEKAPDGWQDPFRPKSKGEFSSWPKVDDIFPWRNNGIMAGRTWVIAPSKRMLEARLVALGTASDKISAFKNSPTGRKFNQPAKQLPPSRMELTPLTKIINYIDLKISPFSYRSFDRQYILSDARLLDRPGPQLWNSHSEKQIYFTSLLSHPLGTGQALTVCACLPDKHHFRGSFGAKDIIPLYFDNQATTPNIIPGLLNLLGNIQVEDLAGYIYCLLAHPEYTSHFSSELINCEVRVPFTKNKDLFNKAAEFGKYLIWLHTYGERLYNSKDRTKGKIPKGSAKNTVAVSDSEENYPNEYNYNKANKTITLGNGKFSPVSKDIWEFEVSGFKVVKSWLGYRMRERKGKKSSPLDDIYPQSWTHEFTREFLELLWILEKSLEGYSKQKVIFDRILASDLYKAKELPTVPKKLRKGPKIARLTMEGESDLFDEEK